MQDKELLVDQMTQGQATKRFRTKVKEIHVVLAINMHVRDLADAVVPRIREIHLTLGIECATGGPVQKRLPRVKSRIYTQRDTIEVV